MRCCRSVQSHDGSEHEHTGLPHDAPAQVPDSPGLAVVIAASVLARTPRGTVEGCAGCRSVATFLPWVCPVRNPYRQHAKPVREKAMNGLALIQFRSEWGVSP